MFSYYFSQANFEFLNVSSDEDFALLYLKLQCQGRVIVKSSLKFDEYIVVLMWVGNLKLLSPKKITGCCNVQGCKHAFNDSRAFQLGLGKICLNTVYLA